MAATSALGFVVRTQASELLGFWVLFFWGVQGGLANDVLNRMYP
jgi:hypothetical protein